MERIAGENGNGFEEFSEDFAAAEAETLMSRATFFEPLWRRQAYALARDETGTYRADFAHASGTDLDP